jgi:hypothetical protein
MSIENIRASVNPAHIQRLMPFKATIDIRYYLNGICVEKAEKGGVYLIASDGHTMCVIHDATGTLEGADSIIFRVTPGLPAAAKLAGNKMHKTLPYRLLVQGQRVKIACGFDSDGDAELFVQAGRSLIEGKFPNWRKVVPDLTTLKPGFGDSMNAHYLARLSKLTTDRRFQGLSLWQAEAGKAIVARVPLVPEMIVVMMPMRSDNTDVVTAFKGFPVETVKAPEPELEAA